VPALIRLLKDKESDVRAYAAWALWHIARKSKTAVPALASALKKEKTPCRRFGSMAFYTNWDVMRTIAASLSRFGRAAVPALMALLKHPRNDVRWCALYALSEIGPGARRATASISRALRDKDEGVRELAVSSLVEVKAPPKVVIPLLIEALKSKSGGVRLAAAEGLGHFGPKARAAVPLLLKTFKADNIDIGGSTWTIGQALKRIDPDAARKAGIP
jgi:HEAT repeat protein